MNKRRYKISKRTANTRDVTSFVLTPEDGAPCAYRPGEYLVFEIPTPNGELIRREYSISGGDGSNYRVTIKREPPPAGKIDLPPGVGSNWMHNSLDVGATIEALGPTGAFILREDSDHPVVLISGGVGLTPLLSMAKRLVSQGRRKLWFIHGCENGEMHILREEIRAMEQDYAGLKTCTIYREPLASDRLGVDYQYSGFLTTEILQAVLPLDHYEFYLCGPGGFMKATYAILSALGVQDGDIFYEFFGPATLLKKNSVVTHEEKSAQAVIPTQPMVTFASTGLSVQWEPAIGNLLDFAEKHGFSPEFGCRSGTCVTCRTTKQSGEVKYLYEPLDPLAENQLLLCSCYPVTDLVLDV